MKRSAVVAHEGVLQQEIFRRITGDSEFGKHHYVAASFRGSGVVSHDESLVPLQVAHCGVHLRQRNLQPLAK